MDHARTNSDPTAKARNSWRTAVVVGLAAVVAMPFVPAPVALALGAFVGLVVGNPETVRTQTWAPRLLAASIVGLGASVNLVDVASVGARGAGFTVVTVALCLALGLALSRVLKIEPETGLLVAVGTAICGGTAIAAMAPIVRARRDQTSVALGTVFMLNAMAMLILPWIGRALSLDETSFGTLAALAVHDTSAVVGAASSFGPRAVEIATTVKLARAMFLVPVAFGISAIGRFRSDAHAGATARPPFPWFIVGFVATSALVTFVPATHAAGLALGMCARRAMVVALYLVGAGTSRAALGSTGTQPLVLGGALWVVVCGVALLLVVHG